MKKTVTEWLGELKLTEKKINKTFEHLKKTEMFIAENAQDVELYKLRFEENKKNVLSSFESLKKLIENKNKIKEAIMSFNATNTIKINDKEYCIALALELYKKGKVNPLSDLIASQIHNRNSRINIIKEIREDKKEMLLDSLTKKTNSSHSGDQEALEKAIKPYELFLDDYLKLDEVFDNIEKENIDFIENLNIQLNLKNATSELEIDL